MLKSNLEVEGGKRGVEVGETAGLGSGRGREDAQPFLLFFVLTAAAVVVVG